MYEEKVSWQATTVVIVVSIDVVVNSMFSKSTTGLKLDSSNDELFLLSERQLTENNKNADTITHIFQI